MIANKRKQEDAMFYITRFKDIERREYECEVVTPLFLGGADPQKAELRVPPIKAAMRFWWRALYGGEDTTKEMAEREAAIFGSTDKKSTLSVTVHRLNSKTALRDLPPGKMVPVEGKTYKTSIINYLAYGLFEYKNAIKKNVYTKEHIEPASRMKIIISFLPAFETDVLNAFKTLITFGGIGARSRNGFGALCCTEFIDQKMKKAGELKSFTSFSKETKLFNKFNKHENWSDALSEVGEVYRNARLKLDKRHSWDNRRFIALPIEAQRENIPEPIRHGRHAKPYFLHVNKTTDGKYQGQILFLPYLYKATPGDRSNQVPEYMAACGKMNEEIEKAMGGAK